MSDKSRHINKIIHISVLSAANGLVYGFNALYYCFLQIYFEKFHTPVHVGILLSVGPFVAIFAPMFWGIQADKAKYKNNILTITVIGSAVFFFLLMVNHNFWWLFGILFILMFFMSPFAGLIDTITLEYSMENKVAYGPMRLTGTFVFGLIPMVLTIFTETNINVIFYAYLIIALLCLIAIKFMPKIPGHAKNKSKKFSIKPVVTDKRFIMIVCILFTAQIAWSYYMNFFPTYMTGTLKLPQTVWGMNVFVTVLGEIPFFLLFNSIFSKFGINKLLLIGIILTIVRYFGLSLFSSAPMILIIALITGFSVTILTYCGAVHIVQNMQPEIKASAQTFMYAIAGGIPKVLSGVIGGFMTDMFGVKYTLFILTGLCLVMLVMYRLFLKQPLIRENDC